MNWMNTDRNIIELLLKKISVYLCVSVAKK